MPAKEQCQCSDAVPTARLQALCNKPKCLCVSKGYSLDISTCCIWLLVKNKVLSGEHALPMDWAQPALPAACVGAGTGAGED